jgi:hypothetical protein
MIRGRVVDDADRNQRESVVPGWHLVMKSSTGEMRVYQDLGRRPHGLQAASTYNGMDQGYSGTTLKTNDRINL